MADKKITELSELDALSPEDLFVVVDDPTGTPVTKRMRANTVLSSFVYNVNAAATTEAVGFKATIVPNAVYTGAATIRGAEFVVSANATAANTKYQYGLVVQSILNGATANVITEHAAGKFVLNVSNAAALISNTYGLLVEVANTGTRTANVRSFVTFADRAANSTTAQTLYLFDAGVNGSANVSFSSTNSNSLVMVTASEYGGTQANSTPTHKIKVSINGVNYWLLVSNTHQ